MSLFVTISMQGMSCTRTQLVIFINTLPVYPDTLRSFFYRQIFGHSYKSSLKAELFSTLDGKKTVIEVLCYIKLTLWPLYTVSYMCVLYAFVCTCIYFDVTEQFCLFGLRLYVPVNNFSVMSG